MYYKKGQKFTLPVVGENPGQYIVDLGGKNIGVKKFEFQKGKDRPEVLSVIVDKADEFRTILKQDMAPILSERYVPGAIHDFKVDADMTMTEVPHYKVSEGLGYWIMLFPKPGIKLSKGDMVRCRIGEIKGINLNLEIVGAAEGAFVKPLGIADLFAGGNRRSILRLTAHLRGKPEMARAVAAEASHDYEWIFQAIRGAREVLFNVTLDDLTEATLDYTVTFRNLLAWLLEDSTYLNDFPTSRRLSLRDELARMVSYADDLAVALRIVLAGEQQKYIEDIFSKLRTSGYLYRPESKLRTLMCIVSLNGEWMDSHMTTLIDIIHKGKESVWKAEPFRTAFVNQLQLYIDTNHLRLDMASDVEGPDEIERLDKMIVALAIQQLLRSDYIEDKDVDYTVNRSRLYRYFSFKRSVDRKKMLDKAMRVLPGESFRRDEFGWQHTVDTGKLSAQMLRVDEPEGSTYRYDMPKAALITDGVTIELRSPDDKASYTALPASLTLWSDLKILLSEAPSQEMRNPKTIQQYKRAWKAISSAVFDRQHKPKSDTRTVVSDIRHKPEIGDIVEIVVDGTEGAEQTSYHCTIVDEFYTGDGYVSIRDFNGWKRALPLSAFADSNGNPYKFKGRVIKIDEPNHKLRFNVYTELLSYVLEQVEVDDVVRGVITAQPSGKTGYRYSALTEFGYTVFVDKDSDVHDYYPNGCQVVLRIRDKCNIGPRRGSINAVFAYEEDLPEELRDGAADDLPPVEYESALKVLFQNYTDEQTVEARLLERNRDEDAEAGGMEELLTDEAAAEIMHIIARMGDVEIDLTKSYNYFSVARLLARLMENERMEAHYSRRCHVIEILDEFASNGRVDAKELQNSLPDIMAGDALRPEVYKLQMLLALDRHEYDEKVWEMRRSVSNGMLERLGSLVVSYNALDGFKLVDVRRKIREQICELLHLATDIHPTQIAEGRETVKTEFKTSLIYPAGSGMRRDIKTQMQEILTVICGFMNAFGGRLYIGVSDEGYVRGLENDLAFFGSHDKMTLALNNAIHSHLTYLPNMSVYIQYDWEKYDGREVLIVDVKRAPKPISLDNVYYERVETSTFRVRDENVKEFLRQRLAMLPVYETREERHDSQATKLKTEEELTSVGVAQAPVPLRQPDPVARIATSVLRDNRLHDYEFSAEEQLPTIYVYVDADGSFVAQDTDGWIEADKALTIAMTDTDSDRYVMVVNTAGFAARIPSSQLLNASKGRFAGNSSPMFVSPVALGDSLLVYYRNEDGMIVKQAFTPESIPRCDMWEQGVRILPKSAQPLRCEVIRGDRLSKFRQLVRNGQKIGRDNSEISSDLDKLMRYLS